MPENYANIWEKNLIHIWTIYDSSVIYFIFP